jgi:hypothetical protein
MICTFVFIYKWPLKEIFQKKRLWCIREWAAFFFLWKEFFNVAKSGDHPENHLAKFGHVSHKKVFFLFFLFFFKFYKSRIPLYSELICWNIIIIF